MNEVSYFRIRAQHHSQLALEASDPSLTAAHEAIAAEMTAKVATADPNRKVVLVDGAAVDTYWSPAALGFGLLQRDSNRRHSNGR